MNQTAMLTDDKTPDHAEFRRLFLEEAADLMAEMENGLLQLAAHPEDIEVLNSVFRAAHSIKGGAGMTGYETAAQFVHTVETFLDELRTGATRLTEELTTKLLQATDCLREILAWDPRAALRPAAAELQKDLQARCTESHPSFAPAAVTTESSNQKYRIAWKPPVDTIQRGADPARVLASICDNARVIETICNIDTLPALDKLQFDQSHLSFVLLVETTAPESVLYENFSLLALEAQLEIERIRDQPPVLPSSTPAPAPAPALIAKSPPSPPKTPEATVRLSCTKLDELFDLVGEVVIAQSMTLQILRSYTDAEGAKKGIPISDRQSPDTLHRVIEDLERNTKELQDRMMGLRLISLEQVFNRIPRLVRDLAMQLGKRVKMAVSGAETEIDRALVDKLSDPLMHLVRNCMDHGIEKPEDRKRAGKSQTGTIYLNAYHEGGLTVIEISDDGRGLDTEKIRQKALQTGLIKSPNELPDDQLHLLIFHPGLSTAEKITAVSGRGVGMDAVRAAFEAMAGTIQVLTEPGKGTTFRLRIPITLAILDALLVHQGNSIVAIPVANVLECVRPQPSRLRHIPAECGTPAELFLTRDSVAPVIRLERMLPKSLASETAHSAYKPGMIVLVEYDNRPYAIHCDDIAGHQQILVKSLDANYRRMEGLQGAAILPNGELALVLDLGGVVRMFDNANRLAHTLQWNEHMRRPHLQPAPRDFVLVHGQEERREPACQ